MGNCHTDGHTPRSLRLSKQNPSSKYASSTRYSHDNEKAHKYLKSTDSKNRQSNSNRYSNSEKIKKKNGTTRIDVGKGTRASQCHSISTKSTDSKNSGARSHGMGTRSATKFHPNRNSTSPIERTTSWRRKSSRNGRKVPPTLDLYLSSLPQPIVGCSIYPIITHGDPCQRPKSIKWFRRRPEGKEKEWKMISTGWVYTPSVEDLGFQLRTEFVADGKIYMEQSQCVLPAPNEPQKRTWIRRSVKRKKKPKQHVANGETEGDGGAEADDAADAGSSKPAEFESESSSYETWRVLSWNTLSDEASHTWESKCAKHQLMWPYRIRNLVRHIKMQDADILCLQEIDKHHMLEWWHKCFCEDDGYEAKYAGGKYGCAIFFRRHKFRMVRELKVCFETQIHQIFHDDLKERIEVYPQEQEDIQTALNMLKVRRKGLIFELSPERKIDRDNSDESREDNLFVATLHLYKSHKKKEPFIRLLQIHALLEELARVTKGVKNPKIVVAGDFNSTPDSSIYTYMEAGQVDRNHPELKDSVLLRALKDNLKHSFNFRSSYKEVLRREESYCRHSEKPTPVVEYIWYTQCDDFHAQGVVPIPEKEKNTFPQVSEISSDHQILVAEFATDRIVNANNPEKPYNRKPHSKLDKTNGVSSDQYNPSTPRGADRMKAKRGVGAFGGTSAKSRKNVFPRHSSRREMFSDRPPNSPRASKPATTKNDRWSNPMTMMDS
mmetsp:Transcript_16498/g.29616  ORF Transcript_16498/g.29616 Transcript_16498/m.29616 type:complete len:720 (+) Transcript_16498:351-2510(+)